MSAPKDEAGAAAAAKAAADAERRIVGWVAVLQQTARPEVAEMMQRLAPAEARDVFVSLAGWYLGNSIGAMRLDFEARGAVFDMAAVTEALMISLRRSVACVAHQEAMEQHGINSGRGKLN